MTLSCKPLLFRSALLMAALCHMPRSTNLVSNYKNQGQGKGNGNGSRNTTTGSTTSAGSLYLYFVYDEAGHLLGEYDQNGNLIEEHIWLNDRPIGVITPTGLYYVHTDQLNTPRYMTNASKQLVWEWLSDPFGTSAPNQNPSGLGTFTYDLRMPGQYFDAETGDDYNYFRYYDPTIGRFISSDPIGLAGGINTYAYSGNNPVTNFDPLGEFCTSSGGWTFCAYPGGPAFELPTPQGFSPYIGPSNFLLYHHYEVSVPLGCTSPADAMNGLINNPTPGNPQPATVNGTINNAPVPPLFSNNVVTSYLTKDLVTGAPLVVNITGANSAFGPGYVAREVSNGAVNTYGEGLSPWQSTAFFSPNFEHYWDQRVWGSQTKSFLSKCGCSR